MQSTVRVYISRFRFLACKLDLVFFCPRKRSVSISRARLILWSEIRKKKCSINGRLSLRCPRTDFFAQGLTKIAEKWPGFIRQYEDFAQRRGPFNVMRAAMLNGEGTSAIVLKGQCIAENNMAYN